MISASVQEYFPITYQTQKRSNTLQTLGSLNSARSTTSSRALRDTLKPLALPSLNNSSKVNKTLNSARTTPSEPDFSARFRGTSNESDFYPRFKGIIKEPSLLDLDIKRDKSTNREVRFEFMLDSPKTSFQKSREESSERLMTARKYIRSIDQLKYERPGKVENLDKIVREKYEKVMQVVENTFLTLNIRIKEINKEISDSAIKIHPIEVNQELVNFYSVLMEEICEFPYSFLAKLKIIMITVCSNVSLNNRQYAGVLNQKINNGMFLVENMVSREAIRNHLYRVVLYHFMKAQTDFYGKWKEMFGTGTYKKGDMEELIQVLICIIKPNKPNRRVIRQLQDKINYLREAFVVFDPMVFDEEWCKLKTQEDIV